MSFTILDRYIAQTVGASVALVLLVLLALLTFLGLVEEFEFVGKGQYEIADAFLYVLLTLPQLLDQIFPMVILIGFLIGMGNMASAHELTVMRSAGVSIMRIFVSMMKLGVLLIIMVILVREFIAPQAMQYAQQTRSQALSQELGLTTQNNGFWIRDNNNMINVRNISPGGLLENILIYRFDEQQQLQSMTSAATASYIDDDWRLNDVRISTMGADKITTEYVDNMPWGALLNPRVINMVSIKPEYLSTRGLYSYIQYQRHNGVDARYYEVAFWQKIVSPFSTVVMILLAVPFVFGSLRSVSAGQRVLTGVLIGIGFFLINQSVSNLAVIYHINTMFSALLPTSLFCLLSIYLVRRMP